MKIKTYPAQIVCQDTERNEDPVYIDIDGAQGEFSEADWFDMLTSAKEHFGFNLNKDEAERVIAHLSNKDRFFKGKEERCQNSIL